MSGIVAVWLSGVSWSFKSGDYAAYYAMRLGSPTVFKEVSEMALYFGMGSENVSSSGAIYDCST